MLQVLAERAAWDWIEAEGGTMEMSAVLPVSTCFGSLRSQHGLSRVCRVKSRTLCTVEPDPKPDRLLLLQTAVFGPVLGPDYSTSITLVKQLLDRDMPRVPRLGFG